MSTLTKRVEKLEAGVPGQVVLTEELEAVAVARFMHQVSPENPVHPAEGKYSEAEIEAATDIVVKELLAAVDGATRGFAHRRTARE